MAKFLWARTLLTAYRYVPKVVKQVDSVIMKNALKSAGFDCSGFAKLSTITQVNNILGLMEVKKRAYFIKDYVERVMSNLSLIKQKLLSQIFFENKKIAAIVLGGEFSQRTYYRRILEALEDFEKKMNESDCKIKDFEKDFNDNWIIGIKEMFLSEKSEKNKKNRSNKRAA